MTSTVRSRSAVLALLIPLLLAAACGPSEAELAARMEAVRAELTSTLAGETLPAAARDDLEHRRAWRAVQRFYGVDGGGDGDTAADAAEDAEPDEAPPAAVWVDGTGPLERVDELIAFLTGGEAAEVPDAAAPDPYGIRHLAAQRDRARQAVEEESDDLGRRLADLELTASYTFLARAIHAVEGKVDPASLDVQWYTEGRKADPLALLAAVRDGARPAEVLDDLEPKHAAYRRLVAARERYRELAAAGGWPAVAAEGETLEEGAEGARVAALRRRLAAGGDLPAAAGEAAGEAAGSAVFDAEVAAAVRRFQERHGLEADGKVGAGTLEALNLPVEARLRTVEVNLERWRWMPGTLGDRYIVVNVPEYRLRAMRGGEVELEMDVIVGKPYHETPAFSDTMTYLVLNPYWNIPESIAGDEVVPKILSQPGYAASQGIDVVTPDGRAVPAGSVLGRRTVEVEAESEPQPRPRERRGFFERLFGDDDDTAYAPEPPRRSVVTRVVTTLPEGHRLRQAPGSENPLGEVKFMFPNEHDVYLHDTPADGLFESTDRGFSHGCIRLERPLELADYVLREDGDWPPRRIRETIVSGETVEVELPEEIPVHLTYFTAWADDDGRVHFRSDLYGHDARLAEALAREAPLTLDLDRLRGAARTARAETAGQAGSR
jgi:L,D-transpeptidase YcbB